MATATTATTSVGVTPETVFFTNVLSLGLNVSACAEKYRLKIEPTMFRQPNVKGMEVMMHFLFTVLDPKDAAEVSSLDAN